MKAEIEVLKEKFDDAEGAAAQAKALESKVEDMQEDMEKSLTS